MSIIAIDPGTSNTGLVYMDERRIICCKSLTFKDSIKCDQQLLRARAQNISRIIRDFISDKPHDAIVIEGFVNFGSRSNAYTFQTPYLCGYLHAELSNENIVVQTSTKVLPKKKGGNDKELMARGVAVWTDCEKCTNDHLRSAAAHGIYYYRSKQ